MDEQRGCEHAWSEPFPYMMGFICRVCSKCHQSQMRYAGPLGWQTPKKARPRVHIEDFETADV